MPDYPERRKISSLCQVRVHHSAHIIQDFFLKSNGISALMSDGHLFCVCRFFS